MLTFGAKGQVYGYEPGGKGIDLNTRKELFSDAYLYAVASAAGCTLAKPNPDLFSVDWTITSPEKFLRWFPSVDVQLKCTSAVAANNGHFRYPLPVKNHTELQGDRYGNPRILVMVRVPEDVDYWLQQSEEQLIMRHCGYWVSLREEAESANTDNVTVRVPQGNQFTVEALASMMRRIGNGGHP